MKKKNKNVKDYLNLAKSQGINPNFYLSIPYLELSESKCYEKNDWLWIENEGWVLFPPLNYKFTDQTLSHNDKKIWSDFNFHNSINHKKIFLDYEYIFNPTQFLHMEGKNWKVFRKNYRKWGIRNEEWIYCNRFDIIQSKNLLMEWFTNKINKIQDSKLITDFVFSNRKDIHKYCLYDSQENLKALNVWDENWKYINYRLCIVRKEPFLDEFARWLFYTSNEILNKKKLVNDGGIVDNIGLEKFKDKLNPINKREVYSYIKL